MVNDVKAINERREAVAEFHRCPRCGAELHVQRLTDGFASYIVDPSFCPSCGQALKWGKNE